MVKGSPESLVAGSTSVEELSVNHEQALFLIAEEHRVALGGLSYWTEKYRASGLNLQTFLKQNEEELLDRLSDTNRNVRTVLNITPEVLNSLSDFSAVEKQKLAAIMGSYSLFSVKREIERQLPRPLNLAVHAALDKRVILESDQAFSIYSAQAEVNRHASSPTAAAGMLAALDRRVVSDVKSNFSLYSARRDLDQRASQNVTADIANAILEDTFPDELLIQRLKEARQQFTTQYDIPFFINLDSPPTQQRLRDLQNEISAMEAELADVNAFNLIKKKKLEAGIKEFKGYERVLLTGLSWLQNNPHVLQEWQNLENTIKRGYKANSNGAGRQKRTSGKQGTGSQKARSTTKTNVPENERIYQHALNQLSSADRSLGQTLTGYPRHQVLKVINTIILARQKAAEKGQELNDRDILIRYMKISNNNPNATPEQVQATQIMLTLMGNKVSGKLPF